MEIPFSIGRPHLEVAGHLRCPDARSPSPHLELEVAMVSNLMLVLLLETLIEAKSGNGYGNGKQMVEVLLVEIQ